MPATDDPAAAPAVDRRSRTAKAAFIVKALDDLVGDVPIPLRHRDPFTLLVAVILSGQSTDAKVNQITPALFARASTPAAMAALPVAAIEDIIRPCGLAPSKARSISETSRILLERHGGEVPRTQEELEALPGVGPKTAQVVLAQAFGADAFPVDTHIHRLAYRWGLSPGRSVARTERDLEVLWNVTDAIGGKTPCPFGDAAIAPPQSTLQKFRDEYEYHVREKQCWRKVAPTFAEALEKTKSAAVAT